MTEKLSRRQLMRRGFWLTVGAAVAPLWARKLSEDMERVEPKPRVFMPLQRPRGVVFMEADYTQAEIRTWAQIARPYARQDADYTLRGLAKSHGVFDHKTAVARYDSGVRYRRTQILQDEIQLEEDPNGQTIAEYVRDMLNYIAMSGITFDQAYIDELMKRHG